MTKLQRRNAKGLVLLVTHVPDMTIPIVSSQKYIQHSKATFLVTYPRTEVAEIKMSETWT